MNKNNCRTIRALQLQTCSCAHASVLYWTEWKLLKLEKKILKWTNWVSCKKKPEEDAPLAWIVQVRQCNLFRQLHDHRAVLSRGEHFDNVKTGKTGEMLKDHILTELWRRKLSTRMWDGMEMLSQIPPHSWAFLFKGTLPLPVAWATFAVLVGCCRYLQLSAARQEWGCLLC